MRGIQFTESRGPRTFSELRENLARDYSALPQVKLALVADSPTQFLHQALRGSAYARDLNPVVYDAGHDAIDLELSSASSALCQFGPEFVLLFESTQKLRSSFHAAAAGEKAAFAATHLRQLEARCEALSTGLDCTIICCNHPELDDGVYGQYANKTSGSFLHQLRKINVGLMELSARTPNLFIADLATLQNRLGRRHIVSNVMHTIAGFAFHLDFWPYFAASVLDIVQALRGRTHKAVIVDLDNTLWGGIIAEDGLSRIQVGSLGAGRAFTEFQEWLKQLKQRGILLAVCSKNDEQAATEVFERHPDMVLRLEDFAVFVANWENKVDNIRHIQSILNIGFDSMVYLDDSPFERAMVRDAIPSLTTPELPADPADYLDYLCSLNLFETASVSTVDDGRTQQYQAEARRARLQRTYASEDEFLASLGMVAHVAPFDSFQAPRITQLSQRSNQFNLRTVRYTERDVERLATDPACFTLCFTLRDQLGDYGLVCVVVLRRACDHLFIENWMMSCRVLKRGLDAFALNQIVRVAEENGYHTVVGEFLPSGRNELVRDHYARLGFSPESGRWSVETAGYVPRRTHIHPESPSASPPVAGTRRGSGRDTDATAGHQGGT